MNGYPAVVTVLPVNNDKQTTMTISIAPELKKKVKEAAKKEYQNYSAWVVDAIKKKLEAASTDPPVRKKRPRTKRG